MVSKIIKKTPIKSIKDRRRRRRKRSPIENGAAGKSSAVIATINKSLLTCQRRLVKIFSKLACIGTPNRRKGFQILKNFPLEEEDDEDGERTQLIGGIVPRVLVFENHLYGLPPLLSPDKRTIFLDLDETLIHSTPETPPEKYDFVVRPRIDGDVMDFYVLKRPGVDEFLEALGAKFEVVVFTAGLKEYASQVLDRLDRNAVISHRLYRDSCRQVDGKFVKDLSTLGRDLRRVVIVDDNPNSYECNPENAIPVRPFVNDLEDNELPRLIQFFEGSHCYDDMRAAIKHYLKSC